MSKSELRSLVLSATLLGALAASCWQTSPAWADKKSGTTTLETIDYAEKDGDWVEFYKDEHDREWVVIVQDYKVVDVIIPKGDPGPDDVDHERGDLRSIIGALKQRGGPLVLEPAFADTPLGRLLTRQAKGIVPVYNPSESGFDPGEGPGGGFDPGGGSPQDQLKKHLNHGKGNGGKGDDGSDLKPGDVGLFDDDMPGPPALVNPNPVLSIGKRNAAGEGGGGPTGGGAGGGAHASSNAAGRS
jgi:hypothetical protein